MGGAVGEQHGARRGYRVDDTDDGFLRDVPTSRPRQGQDQRADEGREESDGVRLPRVHVVADEERGGRAQRGDLGQGDIDEDDLTGQNVDAEVGVDPGEDEAHQERDPQQLQQVDHVLLERLGQRLDVEVDGREVVVGPFNTAYH